MALGQEKYFDLGAMGLGLTLAGVAAPEVKAGCEIGSGGLSAAVAAASRPATSWCAGFTRKDRVAEIGALVERAGLPLDITHGIESFCARDDLPMFDFIGVNINWSLLGSAAQASVLDLVARRLRPGGVVSMSCLVLPGSGQDTPLRVLGRTLLRGATPDDADFDVRFAAMLDDAETALATAPLMLARHPEYLGLIAEMRANQDLAGTWRHWFDPRWEPTTFLALAEQMGGAGLSFAAPAELAYHAREINYTPRQRALLAAIDDVPTREQMADLISYTWGRADYWVKAPVRLDADARARALRDMRLTLSQPASEFEYRIDGMLGHVSLRREVYGPLLAQTQATPGVRLGDLHGDLETVAEAAALFVSAGAARVTEAGVGADVRAACRRFNTAVFAAAAAGRAVAVVASPELQGGVDVSPRITRFLAAWSAGARDAADLARSCALMEAEAGAPDQGEAMRITRDANDFLSESREFERLGVL